MGWVNSYRRRDGTLVRGYYRGGFAGAAIGLVVAVVAVAALAANNAGTPRLPARSQATLITVVDGDTVRARVSSDSARVRLLGVDSPEVSHGGTAGQCYGRRASATLRGLVASGAKVTLVRDPTQPNRDTYGRLLRYVDLGRTDLSLALVRAGAAWADTSAPLTSREKAYERAERRARAQAVGLWGACRSST